MSEPTIAELFDSADYELVWPRHLLARELRMLRAGADTRETYLHRLS